MSTAAQLVDALRDALAADYPARIGEQSNITGRVTAVVLPTGGEYDAAAMCDPVPVDVRADIALIAAQTGETALRDLLAHIDPVAALVRAAGWYPTAWAAASIDDRPAVTLTAQAHGDG